MYSDNVQYIEVIGVILNFAAMLYLMYNGMSCRKYKSKNLFIVGNREGNRPLASPKHRWEDNIKIDVEEIV
jgi:hypothetical protein